VPREQVVRMHASSGTTGKPTVVGYTREDIDMWAGVMARSIRAAGVRPGDVCTTPTATACSPAAWAHYGAEKLGCTVVPISGGHDRAQVQLIQDFGCKIMMVTPSYFLSILDEFERQGIDPARPPCGSASSAPSRGRPPCAPRSNPGATWTRSTSTACPRSSAPAWRCESAETKDGLHIWEDHFYPEIIDP
jgi:phenylacetate-CoA ligase